MTGVTDLARTHRMTLHSVGRKNKVRGFRVSSYDVDEVADVKFQFNYSVLLCSKTSRFRRFIAFLQNSQYGTNVFIIFLVISQQRCNLVRLHQIFGCIKASQRCGFPQLS